MDCIFCKIANGDVPSNILYEDDLVMVIMDNSPVVDGHALVIPKKHYTDYKELDANILQHVLKIADEIGNKIANNLHKSALTFLVNYGDTQVVKHFHLHLLPNYSKKTVDQLEHTITENFNLINEK